MTIDKAKSVINELKLYVEDLQSYSADEVAEALEISIKILEDQPQTSISKEKVDEIRHYLIEHVFLSPAVMFDDNIRGYDCNDIDLVAIICDLYEYIHNLVYGKDYDYMFHWANKCGSWVETGEFDAVIEEIMKEKENKGNEKK